MTMVLFGFRVQDDATREFQSPLHAQAKAEHGGILLIITLEYSLLF